MSTIIKYESKLLWMKPYRPSREIIQRITNEIATFKPRVPIQYIDSFFCFSVDKEQKYICVKIEIDKNILFGGKVPEDGEWESLLDETITSRLKDVLFTMNLAYPGVFHIKSSIIYRDGHPLLKSFSFSSDLSGCVHEKCDWLVFENLTIHQCWDWIVSKTNFLSYISRTPIDRALAALSYESVANDDVYIFYALLGIEALYNDGNNREDSILEQLRRKSQALLGEFPTIAQKSLKEMYRMRSKLVHGSSNIFKCWSSEIYEETEYDKLESERNYMVFATGILLATIQKFISANANTLIETITVRLE